MNRRDVIWLAALTLSGAVLWTRMALQAAAGWQDTLPLLIAFPLLWKAGAPWRFFAAQPGSVPVLPLAIALLLAAAGEVAGAGVLTATGWTLALGTWLYQRTDTGRRPLITRLMVLPLLGFPWLMGAGGLGWHFRLSAAWITEQFFHLSGLALTRDGTLLSVQGQALSVEAACAGLGSLQAMLLAGAAAAALELGKTGRFWIALPILFVAAWAANTIRVVVISGAALSAGHDFATSAFHGLSGLVILVAIFGGCLALFRCFRPGAERRSVVIRRYAHPA